ncbi:hypothetical protein CK227_17355 [Mesorhizobium sp. WSM4308]|nr:hypothetical protein CK232_18705 [Mesorhizobium sp. WSM4304]PBB74429.1 hypothetical protein CK227_17355 [Mesorhizobium sp. WSM4308]
MIMTVIFLDETAGRRLDASGLQLMARLAIRSPSSVKGMSPSLFEAAARHGDAGMIDAVALRDAYDAKVGLDADIVRQVPPSDPVAATEIATPVAQESIVARCG